MKKEIIYKLIFALPFLISYFLGCVISAIKLGYKGGEMDLRFNFDLD